MSVDTLARMERRGEFPRRRQLGPRRVGYLFAEVEQWLASRPVSDLPPVPRGPEKAAA